MTRKKSAAQLNREIHQALSASTRVKASSPFNGKVHAWSERHDQYAPEDWLFYVLDGTYTVPEMQDAIRADRDPVEGKKSARVTFRGDTHAWCEQHDQFAPEDWLNLILDGTYSVAEMRAAVLENRLPKGDVWTSTARSSGGSTAPVNRRNRRAT